MNTRLKYLSYKGKRILYVDYSNLSGERAKEALVLLDDEANEMRSWTQRGLVLSDFRNSKANSEFIAYGKKLGKEVFAEKVLKSACYRHYRCSKYPSAGI